MSGKKQEHGPYATFLKSSSFVVLISKIKNDSFSKEKWVYSIITVPPPVWIFLPLRSPSHIYSYRIGLQDFGQKENEGKNMLYNPRKRNFAKGHFKGQKKPCFCFLTKLSPLDPYKWLRREGISSKGSIPEFRYWSLLHSQFEKSCILL